MDRTQRLFCAISHNFPWMGKGSLLSWSNVAAVRIHSEHFPCESISLRKWSQYIWHRSPRPVFGLAGKPCFKTSYNQLTYENGVIWRFSEWKWKLESKLSMQFGKYGFLRMNLLQCTRCLVVTDSSVAFYMSFYTAYCPVDAHILAVQWLILFTHYHFGKDLSIPSGKTIKSELFKTELGTTFGVKWENTCLKQNEVFMKAVRLKMTKWM